MCLRTTDERCQAARRELSSPRRASPLLAPRAATRFLSFGWSSERLKLVTTTRGHDAIVYSTLGPKLGRPQFRRGSDAVTRSRASTRGVAASSRGTTAGIWLASVRKSVSARTRTEPAAGEAGPTEGRFGREARDETAKLRIRCQQVVAQLHKGRIPFVYFQDGTLCADHPTARADQLDGIIGRYLSARVAYR